MANKPEPTLQLLGNPIFHEIKQRVALHNRLLKKIREAVPGNMAEHCLGCVAREDGGLVIYTDSQAFASQLRFHAPLILARLNAAGEAGIKRIAIRNLPVEEPPPETNALPPLKIPSAAAIAAVKASARPDGDELDAVLARLAASMERYAAGKKP